MHFGLNVCIRAGNKGARRDGFSGEATDEPLA